MPAVQEVLHRVNVGPVHLLAKLTPVDTSDGPKEIYLTYATENLSASDSDNFRHEKFLRVINPERVEVAETWDGVTYHVVRYVEGLRINQDPETRGRLRFK